VYFGRVEGVVVPVRRGAETWLRLTVYLETGSRLDVVREQILAPLRPLSTAADLSWHADQLTQETIGTDLAAQGWEVIGGGEPPVPEPGELARSATYAVRRLG
jgi:hypothetical protein